MPTCSDVTLNHLSFFIVNLIFVCQDIGDTKLAYQCLRLTIASDNDHAEAYNNLGVLELRKNTVDGVSQRKRFILFFFFNFMFLRGLIILEVENLG